MTDALHSDMPSMSEQTKWERETGIFRQFLDADPNFAGVPIAAWKHNQNDSPDILCTDRLGNRTGVEMTEWLDQAQTRDFARWAKIFSAVTPPQDWAIDVYLTPFGHFCAPQERQQIVAELTEVIARQIARPKVRRSGLCSFTVNCHDSRQTAPTTAKYCDMLAGYKIGSRPIQLMPGGSFSRAAPEDALREVISKKLRKKSYAALLRKLGLRALYLLVYYDIGIVKNTPNIDVDAPGVAASAASVMPNAFDAVFLLMFPGGDASSGRTVHRIDVIRTRS